MTMVATYLPFIVFGGVVLAALLMYLVTFSRDQQRRAKIGARINPQEHVVEEVANIVKETRDESATIDLLGPVAEYIRMARLRAGDPGPVSEIAVSMAALGIITPLILSLILDGPIVVMGVFAGALPLMRLNSRGSARAAKISHQLPDALDLMSRSLRAGHAFSDALRMTALEMPDPIGKEFMHTTEEHLLGIELRPCMEGLVARVPNSFELRLFVGAVLLNRDTGGNLIEILENLAAMVRERVVFEGKVQALTSEVRTSAGILSSLPFGTALLLETFQPGYLQPLMEPGLGRQVMFGGMCSMLLGISIMRKLANVEM